MLLMIPVCNYVNHLAYWLAIMIRGASIVFKKRPIKRGIKKWPGVAPTITCEMNIIGSSNRQPFAWRVYTEAVNGSLFIVTQKKSFDVYLIYDTLHKDLHNRWAYDANPYFCWHVSLRIIYYWNRTTDLSSVRTWPYFFQYHKQISEQSFWSYWRSKVGFYVPFNSQGHTETGPQQCHL